MNHQNSEISTTENEMKNKVCPYLSCNNTFQNCVGTKCVAFTVTKTHSKKDILIFANSNKKFSGNAEHFYLDSNSVGYFIEDSSWKTVVEYNDATYTHMHTHQKKLTESDDTGNYSKSEKLPSCEGYCFLSMKNEKVILPL